jgi:CubicO group peptidase (beta-lactamase class C family)
MIPALWVFVSVTATPVHSNPESVPTAMHSQPSPKWAGAVEQGRRIVRASVAGQNLPGLSVAIGIDGEVVWAEGFGFADLKTSLPVTPDHRFRIGSASTVLTSAAAGLLLENSRLKLDDEIQMYVPAFPRMKGPVTLRQLMGHSPGVFPDIDGDEPALFTKHCARPVEMLQHFPANWLLFEPGTYARYSIYDWILVSAAVEAAADQPFLKFMRERIFDPLQMRDTIPDPATVEPGEDEDFPLFNLIRELIHDPEATRDTAVDSKPVQDRVTSYDTRFRSDPNYGMYVMRPGDYSSY